MAKKKTHGFVSRYKTDKDLVEKGTWIDFGDGVKVQIRSANSVIAAEALDELYRPYRALMKANRMPADRDQELMQTWAGQALIVDWEGLPDDDGETMAHSTEAAIERCQSLPEFALDVINIAKTTRTYSPFDADEAAGNSPRRSRGKATTENA